MGIEFVDQSEAVRQTGRDDYAAGEPFNRGAVFFGTTSSASDHWREGWLEAADAVLLRASETVTVPPESPVAVSEQIGESNE